MKRRGLGIRLLATLLILLALLFGLVTLDIWYTAGQAEQQGPQPKPPDSETTSTEVE